VAFGCCVLSSASQATTAKEWLGLGRDEQRGVVTGLVNAWEHAGSVALMAGQNRLADFFIAPLQCVAKLKLGARRGDRLVDLVKRHVTAQQGVASQDIARAARTAIVAACEPAKGK
jgi:hypothetical protein